MLLRLDRHEDAADAFRRALTKAPTEAERRHLRDQLRVAAARSDGRDRCSSAGARQDDP
jgi:predicted RNA polymerase sigma factor